MINIKSARIYCRDDISKIENYDKAMSDTTQTWNIHHRLELTLDGEFALNHKQLKLHGMYYHRPCYELIFLTRSEHMSIHGKARRLTDDTKRKLSESLKGRHVSEETRKKKSEAMKGRTLSEEWCRHISESCKGKNKGKPLSATNRLNKAKAQAEIGAKYRAYKSNGGTLTYNEFRASIKKQRSI